MRIGIVGASGRVGTRLVETIIASPGLVLAAALVSPGSRLIGQPVAGGSIEYRPAEAAMNSHCDVMIDFSTPKACLALQESVGDKNIPMVIGTTGFSPEEDARLTDYAAFRPMLVSANFAYGFEAFAQAAAFFARQMPGAEPVVVETYHARKKAEPSGTSQRLARQVHDARSRAMAFDAAETPILIHREGDVVGINEVRFRLGSGEASFTYTVQTLAAYAEGAISAAQWLVGKAPKSGRFGLADSLNPQGA
jgi:4-hydroxy-tetrahydrodipicolinate reductase